MHAGDGYGRFSVNRTAWVHIVATRVKVEGGKFQSYLAGHGFPKSHDHDLLYKQILDLHGRSGEILPNYMPFSEH
jgi:hypothetical protein